MFFQDERKEFLPQSLLFLFCREILKLDQKEMGLRAFNILLVMGLLHIIISIHSFIASDRAILLETNTTITLWNLFQQIL